MICEQCGRCCRYIILPCNPGGKLDKDLSELRGLVLYGDSLLVPCECILLYPELKQGMEIIETGRYACIEHGTAKQPQACIDQKAGGWGCLLLHEAIP